MAYRRKPAAGPTGSALVEAMRGKLDEGWPTGLTLLTGDDLYHLDRAQQLLIEKLVPADSSEFALGLFGSEKVDVGSVVGAARSIGMFAPRRVIVMRDVEMLTGEPDALLEYAKEPPANSYLVVRAPSLDQRRKLHKALAKSGTTLVFSAPGEDMGRLRVEVAGIAKERGITLDRESVDFLAEISGGDLWRVANELEKIAVWTGSSTKKVDLDTVREVASGGAMVTGWEVANAVLARDANGAISAARRLIAAGDEPIRIVGGLAWRARVMLQAKALLEKGTPRGDVLREARAWSYRDELFTGLERYSLGELLRFPAHLLEADRCFKSRSLDRGAVLETLVRKLTATTGGPVTRRAGSAPRRNR
jgi:DNA polymerase-3 subunit delta